MGRTLEENQGESGGVPEWEPEEESTSEEEEAALPTETPTPHPPLNPSLTATAEKSQIFVLRTTSGQEVGVANQIQTKIEAMKRVGETSGSIPTIYSILIPSAMKGYIFVEAAGPHFVDDLTSGLKHARRRIPGLVKIEDLDRYLVAKPVIKELGIGDTVEVIAGPLKGMRAKITKIDKGKNEITVELLEAAITLPITVNAEYVRLTGKKAEGD